jgi:hypothetical protein
MKKAFNKTIVMLVVIAIMSTVLSVFSFAEGGANVTVTIKNGGIVVARETVEVTDIDEDGALTINDALYCAHEKFYDGGAAAGYGSGMSDWGLSLTKLWGDNSGSFGYCVNDASSWGLSDPVKQGDYVYAFVYEDQTGWSDAYSYFDKSSVSAVSGEEITLNLTVIGYDADYNPVPTPCEGATITVDGKETSFVTDSEGNVTVTIPDAGSHVISAVSKTAVLVSPICLAQINPGTNDNGLAVLAVCVMVAILSASLVIRKKINEK